MTQFNFDKVAELVAQEALKNPSSDVPHVTLQRRQVQESPDQTYTEEEETQRLAEQ